MSSFSDTSDEDSEAEARGVAVLDSIAALKAARGFAYLGKLGEGTYGDVLKLYDTKSGSLKAAKVIIPRNASESEMRIWSSLEHKNIIAVEETMHLSDGTMVVLMPLQFKSLDVLVSDEKFVNNRNSFSYMRRWMLDSLEGVDYMHRNRTCHLDLKLDNILISHQGLAMIADFSFANSTTQPLENADIGLPNMYRPPELFEKGSDNLKVGTCIDSWAFGILVLEAVTNECLLNRIRKCTKWKRDVRPVLELILHQHVFEAIVKNSFPNYSFKKNELEDALDFIDGFLSTKREKRFLTSQALRHRFMQDSEAITVDLKNIYGELKLHKKYGSDFHAEATTKDTGDHRSGKVLGVQTPVLTGKIRTDILRSDKFVKVFGARRRRKFFTAFWKIRNAGFVTDCVRRTLRNFKSLAIEEAQAKFGSGKQAKKKVLLMKTFRRRFRSSRTFRKEIILSARLDHVPRGKINLKKSKCFTNERGTKLVSDLQWEQNKLMEYELLHTLNESNLLESESSRRLQLQGLPQTNKANCRRLIKSAGGFKRSFAIRHQAYEQNGFKSASLTDLSSRLPTSNSITLQNGMHEDSPQECTNRKKTIKSAHSVSEESNYAGTGEQEVQMSPESFNVHGIIEPFEDCLSRSTASNESSCIQRSIHATCSLHEDISVLLENLLSLDDTWEQLKAEYRRCNI